MAPFSVRYFLPNYFLSRAEEALLHERVKNFEAQTGCELIFHFRRKLSGPSSLEACRALFYKYKLNETTHRAAILVTLALWDRTAAVWADENVVRRSGDALWEQVCTAITSSLGRGERLQGLLDATDHMTRVLATEQPHQAGSKNEISHEIITE